LAKGDITWLLYLYLPTCHVKSRHVMAAVLDSIEPEIAPFDPPGTFSWPVTRMTHQPWPSPIPWQSRSRLLANHD